MIFCKGQGHSNNSQYLSFCACAKVVLTCFLFFCSGPMVKLLSVVMDAGRMDGILPVVMDAGCMDGILPVPVPYV